MRALSRERITNLDANFGLPTGMFNGDELLPDPPTRNPSRGIETCGVVEAMFSYTCLGATIGDALFFDRAERISFNAMPVRVAFRCLSICLCPPLRILSACLAGWLAGWLAGGQVS